MLLKGTPPNLHDLESGYRMRELKLNHWYSEETEKKRILVVDDCQKTRSDISQALRNCNHEVETARNREEVLEILESKNIDLVTTELVLPEMSGLYLLRRIKSIGRQIGVIIITEFGGIESYIESMNLGAFEYLTKPVKIFELRKIIDRYFQLKEFSNVKIGLPLTMLH